MIKLNTAMYNMKLMLKLKGQSWPIFPIPAQKQQSFLLPLLSV